MGAAKRHTAIVRQVIAIGGSIITVLLEIPISLNVGVCGEVSATGCLCGPGGVKIGPANIRLSPSPVTPEGNRATTASRSWRGQLFTPNTTASK